MLTIQKNANFYTMDESGNLVQLANVGTSSGSSGGSSGGSSDNLVKYGIWLMDYKTYGENSYVFQDKDIWNELCNTEIAWKDKTFTTSAEPDMYTEHINDITGYMKYSIGLEDYSFNGNFFALLETAAFVQYIITKYITNKDSIKPVFDSIYATDALKTEYLSNIASAGTYYKLEQTFKENSYDGGTSKRVIWRF